MTYEYSRERPKLFNDTGLLLVMGVRDEARRLIAITGAVRLDFITKNFGGDSWVMLAAVDYLVEHGELALIHAASPTQHNVYGLGPKARKL